MEKAKLYTKCFTDEENILYQLEYSLLIRSAEQGRVYGIRIEKTDASGNVEKETVEGLCDNREDAEGFLQKLVEGCAFPVHLAALCDDFISTEEAEKKTSVQAAS